MYQRKLKNKGTTWNSQQILQRENLCLPRLFTVVVTLVGKNNSPRRGIKDFAAGVNSSCMKLLKLYPSHTT